MNFAGGCVGYDNQFYPKYERVWQNFDVMSMSECDFDQASVEAPGRKP
jgi:hypothetical protein